MIYPMVPFPTTLSDPLPRFQGHGITVDALNVLCAQLTCDLFAIAKFLLSMLMAGINSLLKTFSKKLHPVKLTFVEITVNRRIRAAKVNMQSEITIQRHPRSSSKLPCLVGVPISHSNYLYQQPFCHDHFGRR